jgi:hypothetical protein
MTGANGHNHPGGMDAFGEEMRSNHADREFAAVGHVIRRACVAPPAEEVVERHLTALLAEAERIAAGARTAPVTGANERSPSRRTPALRFAIVLASAFITTGGLAIAGVRPPEPFSDLYEAVGFDVPGSDSKHGADDRDDDGSGSAEREPERGESEDGIGLAGEERGSSQPSGHAGDKPGEQRGRREAEDGHPSREGRKTAAQANSGNAPPPDPGRSEDHPSPPALGPDGAGAPGQSSGGGLPPHAQGSPPVPPPGHSEPGPGSSATVPGHSPTGAGRSSAAPGRLR